MLSGGAASFASAAAVAQSLHQLAVIDGAPPEGRLGEPVEAAEDGDFPQDPIGLHGPDIRATNRYIKSQRRDVVKRTDAHLRDGQDSGKHPNRLAYSVAGVSETDRRCWPMRSQWDISH